MPRGDRTPSTRTREAAVWLPVEELRPNPRNPRVHGTEVAALARAILRTTWGAPIIAQEKTRRIIGGHGRLEAARLILRGVEVDGELRGGADHTFAADAPGPGLVPVRLVDVSDAEADAMTLADNARAIQGHDDPAALVEMAAQFGRESALMADLGFDGAALDALVKSAGDAILGATGIAGAEMRDPADAFGALPDGDKPPGQHMAFHFTDDQASVVLAAIDRALPSEGSPAAKRAAALAAVCEAYLG